MKKIITRDEINISMKVIEENMHIGVGDLRVKLNDNYCFSTIGFFSFSTT